MTGAFSELPESDKALVRIQQQRDKGEWLMPRAPLLALSPRTAEGEAEGAGSA